MTKRKRIHNTRRTVAQRSPIKHIDEDGKTLRAGEDQQPISQTLGWFGNQNEKKIMTAVGSNNSSSATENVNHSH